MICGGEGFPFEKKCAILNYCEETNGKFERRKVNNRMKKKIIVLLAAVCAVSVIGGCGTKKEESSKADSKQESSQEETQSEDESKGSDSVSMSGKIEYNAEECVELGEYKGLELALASTYEVTDEDVKSSIDSLLLSYPVYEDTDKTTVEEGDVANIDYEGIKDGVAFEGGTAQGANLEIGSNSFIEGFEEGLIGKKVGEKVSLDLTFPENYQNTELAGKAVVFKVTINKIVKKVDMTYETMTDDYVADNFVSQGYNTVDDMKKGVREQMENSSESAKQSDSQNALFVKLRENCKVTLPNGLLQEKADEYVQQFTENLKSTYDMTLKDYLESAGGTEEEYYEQVNQMIQESLENQIILEAIAKKENIEADDEGYAEYKASVVADFGFESEEALVEQYGEDYVKNAYIGDKTMEFLIDNAKITYDEKQDSADSEQKESEDSVKKEEEKDSKDE